jgi:type VI secretion system protein ImpG
MTDELLPYYERELGFLRHMGAEFARQHPKIAGRLRMGGDAIEDPHVSRLIESVAFLNARVRRKLDDGFPELVDALLEVLHPQFLAPIPSMAIVRFECDPEATASHLVARDTLLETDPSHGPPCRFRTGYATRLWPFREQRARMSPTPFQAPATPQSSRAAAVIQISLACASKQNGFGKLKPQSLRFFLRGQPSRVAELYQRLFEDVLEIAIATAANDPKPIVLPASALRPVGFEPDEGLLPFPARTSDAYRLLSEFFAFPAKFHFVELGDIPADRLARFQDKFEIFLYLRNGSRELEQSVDTETFALGCTPVVNLFRHRAEPIQLTHATSEYHVVPDARALLANEIWSIDSVTAHARDGRRIPVQPFYGGRHHGERTAEQAYWYATRRPAPKPEGVKDGGTELHLQLVDLGFESFSDEAWVLDVRTTCTNRDLPARLPFGVDQPRMSFSEGGGSVKSVRCLTQPTTTVRPERGKDAVWKLVSHLSLNHLSLANGPEALREILGLHDALQSPENRSVIASVLDVQSRAKTLRIVSGGLPGIVRGLEVVVRLDPARLKASGLYLFACVLERFVARYASVNSFIEFVVSSDERSREVRRWKPRAGDRTLV